MNHVLLVFPLPDDEQVTAISPSLSILYLGSYLENAGVPVSYIDLRFHSMDDLYAELDREPMVVGVSSMTGFQLVGAVEVLKACKKRAPEVRTVLGGIHASMTPQQSLSNPLVDFIVVGEGELTLLELVEFLSKGKKDLEKVLGLGWKKNDGTIVINPRRPFMNLADSTPPITRTSKKLYSYYPHGKVQISRGCPFRCGFCYNTSFNLRRKRIKPLENIENEIQVIKKFVPNIKHFTLLSDSIGSNKKRIVDISRLTSKYDFKFHTSIRAEHLDEDLVAEIEDQCVSVLLGVETVVSRIRKLVHKDNKVDDIRKAAHILNNSKMKSYYSFMTGFPYETKAETIANMDFADEIRSIDKCAVITPFFLCTPFPGTALYQKALELGYEEPSSLEDWREYKLSTANMPWIDNKNEHFTSVHGISMLIYLSDESYNTTQFEKEFFTYFKDLAWIRWKKRTLEFRKEWELFNRYNKEIKQAVFKDDLIRKKKIKKRLIAD